MRHRLPLLLAALVLAGCQNLQQAVKTESALQAQTEPPVSTASAAPEAPQPISPAEVLQPEEISPTPLSPAELAEAADLWGRIRSGLTFPVPENNDILTQREWYERNQEYVDRMAGRAGRYLHHIVATIEQRQLPMELALLPIVESAFQPYAYSRSRAAGIWQFISGTGKNFGLEQTWWQDGRRDIVRSTDAALDYLQYLNKMFNGDWQLALAAYNCGEGTVGRALERNRRAGKATDFWSLDLPKETRSYVPKLLALVQLIREPERYALKWPSIPDSAYFGRVLVDSQIDMALAAELAGISADELYQLNPAYTRGTTAPGKAVELLLPIEAMQRFQTNLAQLPASERVQWTHHIVRKGDTLGKIAKQYQVSVEQLRATNKLSGNNLKLGRELLVPKAAGRLPASIAISAPLSTREKADLVKADNGGKAKGFHQVRARETLFSIARKYKISVAELASANQLSSKAALQVGDTLQLPGKAAQSVQPIEKIAAKKTSLASNGAPTRYTVRSGDSLYAIAQKFGVSVKDIQRWNKKAGPAKSLKPGLTLTLYAATANGG